MRRWQGRTGLGRSMGRFSSRCPPQDVDGLWFRTSLRIYHIYHEPLCGHIKAVRWIASPCWVVNIPMKMGYWKRNMKYSFISICFRIYFPKLFPCLFFVIISAFISQFLFPICLFPAIISMIISLFISRISFHIYFLRFLLKISRNYFPICFPQLFSSLFLHWFPVMISLFNSCNYPFLSRNYFLIYVPQLLRYLFPLSSPFISRTSFSQLILFDFPTLFPD